MYFWSSCGNAKRVSCLTASSASLMALLSSLLWDVEAVEALCCSGDLRVCVAKDRLYGSSHDDVTISSSVCPSR